MIDSLDILIRGLIFDKSVNIIAINGRKMVQKARELHELSRVCTAALGRMLLQTAMMSTQLKTETDRLTNIISGDGPIGNIVCTARPNGIVKGYVVNPQVELPPSYDCPKECMQAVNRV
jgi:molecular chaperone Hsp33